MATTVPIPPPEMDFVGGDYDAAGREFLRYFIEFGGLQPHHRVLDVGSGIGRMARPLTGYLGQAGSYDGFDIVGRGVEWCQRNITPRYQNFRFHHADVFNLAYHPDGHFAAEDYVFPYPSMSFDFVLLTSVFTHMRPAAVLNYVREISRVLKLGGRCLCTYFLQTPETRELGKAGRGTLNFVHRRDGYWIAKPDEPDEAAICFDEPDVLAVLDRCGLALTGPIRRGSWSGRTDFLTMQDIVVAEKVRNVARPWAVSGGRMIRAVARKLRRCWQPAAA
jgi:SAM-dependent methyltransferase